MRRAGAGAKWTAVRFWDARVHWRTLLHRIGSIARQNAAFYSILIGNISLKLPDDLLAQLDENPEFRDLLFAYVDVAEPHGRIAA
jgi:hypothetical protein